MISAGSVAPAIVSTELCTPRGTTRRYILAGTVASPGGTENVVQVTYKNQNIDVLREIEHIDRKKMTAICAKNNMAYKRAMAHFVPGERAKQLQAAREQQRKRREARKERARAELALVAAAVGL